MSKSGHFTNIHVLNYNSTIVKGESKKPHYTYVSWITKITLAQFLDRLRWSRQAQNLCITAWVKGSQTKFNKCKQIKTKMNRIRRNQTQTVKHDLVELNQARHLQTEQNKIKESQKEPNRVKLSHKESM